jgi:hypothetical protein
MKNDDIRKLVTFSESLKTFFDNHTKESGCRVRKTDMVDGFVFGLICGQDGMSQQDATLKINNYKGRTSSKTMTHRSCFVDRKAQMNMEFFKKVYEFINCEIKKLFSPDDNSQEIFVVDGTYANLSKDLTETGLKTTKNGEIVNGLFMGVYNITYNYPVSLDLATKIENEKGRDERAAYMSFIEKSKNTLKDSIFILDRGFMKYEMFEKMDTYEIKYICRLPENLIVIPDNNDDTVITTETGHQFRIVTYRINDSPYYIGTNLFDTTEFPAEKIKKMYHDRWTIEEFFKYIKSNMKFENMPEKNYEDVMKSVYSQLIVTRLVNLMIQLKGAHKNEKKAVNKSMLTRGMYRHFIMDLFYNRRINRRKIRDFMDANAVYINVRRGEHYERKSIRPYTKWYIKKYQEKYKLVAKNKAKKNRADLKIEKEQIKQQKINEKKLAAQKKKEYAKLIRQNERDRVKHIKQKKIEKIKLIKQKEKEQTKRAKQEKIDQIRMAKQKEIAQHRHDKQKQKCSSKNNNDDICEYINQKNQQHTKIAGQ